ncbi:MAG: hypothetical protein DMG31_09090 [Acidobacteria bacterium]|nr:MAG: hypothetical protein DMG31_09090 [Acidobacteriota bacterium]
MARLFTALRKEPNRDLRDFVLLSLWTGARRGDVLTMRWQNIELADNRWSVPEPKNRTPYAVPLVREAIEMLKDRQSICGTGASGHLVNLKRGWNGLLARAKITDLRIHDLRRTLGSWQAASGASLPVIGKSLGHRSTCATQIYARLDLDPVRASVTAATQAMIAAAKKKPKQLTAAGGGA